MSTYSVCECERCGDIKKISGSETLPENWAAIEVLEDKNWVNTNHIKNGTRLHFCAHCFLQVRTQFERMPMPAERAA